MVQEELQYGLFKETWEQKFEEWVHTPYGRKVAYRFIQTACRLKAQGEKVGAKAIWEWLRIDEVLKDRAGIGKYKLNNNFTAYMARFAESKSPELKDYFNHRAVGITVKKRAVVVEIG